MKVWTLIHLVGNSCRNCRVFDGRDKALNAADAIASKNNIPFFAGMLWIDDEEEESVEVQELTVE